MNSVSIWATVLVVLSIYGSSEAAPSSAPLVKLASYHIVKKPIHVVSDKFLSFTVDPNTITHVADCSLTNATLNMAKSLAPAYFRLAGVDSNRFVFQSNPNSNHTELKSKSKIFSVSNIEWLQLNNFLSKTGMSVIACVSGQTETTNEGWDLSNTLEMITFSDKHNISLDWQLGYELQKLSSSQGKLMGRDVTRLRKILDVFPRYRKSLIIGPDMTSFKSQNDGIFVTSYLTEAADSLNAFTWHPFSKSSEDDEILEMLANGMNSMDTYLWIKEGRAKSYSRGVVPKKSIWIAESDSIETVSNLTDSMTWILRMGAAAKLGASVYLRRPHLLSFYEPTPEYWTAVLYKSLVGRTVLDIKQTSGNGTNKVHMFTHCTKFIDKPDESIINPEISYDPGSITVYGVNMASESTRLSFKIGVKGDETAHIYVLTEDASGDFPKTLLNKQLLGLSSENELPLISPRIRETPKYLLIPGRSIFFVVFPNIKCRSCNEFDSPDSSKPNKVNIFEEADQETNTFTSNVLETMEDENDHDNVYVNYPKRVENSLPAAADSKPLFNDDLDKSNPQNNIKYVTFSDETWLNPFPEKFKDIVSKGNDGTSDDKNPSKARMYRLLAQAMLGKKPGQNAANEAPKVEDPATRFVFEDDSESNQFKRALNKSPARTKRDLESKSAPVNGSDSKTEPEKKIVDSKKDELSLKPALQPSSVNKSESRDDSDEPFDYDNEELPKSVSQLLGEDENSQSFALYLFNPENETLSFQTTKNSSFLETNTTINAILLTNDDLKQALNSTDFNDTIPLITFVHKSTFEYLIEAFGERIKREIHQELPLENVTVPEISFNSTLLPGNFTKTASNGETASTNELIDNILENVSKLLQKFFAEDSFLEKLDSKDVINKTRQRMNRLMTQAMLRKLTTLNSPKDMLRSKDIATKFVLEDETQSDDFKKALQNFDKFKRSADRPKDLPTDDMMITFYPLPKQLQKNKYLSKRSTDQFKESPENFDRLKRSSDLTETQVDSDSSDLALYLFEQQDDEPRSFETQKRSTLSKIYAVPLNEDNLQMALQNPNFRETIPIVTFVRKPTLEDIVEAAKDRVKREVPKLENVTNSETSNNLTVSSSPYSINSSNQSENNPAPQLSTTQTPPMDDKLVKDPSKEITEEADKLIQKFSQIDTKNQSSITPSINFKEPSLPELFKESEGSEISRGLREIDDESESIDNVLGTQRLKTIDKPNMRPVSPFPKKPKNVKSKLAKSSKPKSTDNVQLNRQNIPSISLPPTEPAFSTKRSTQEAVSSNQPKSADLVENAASSDDSEEDSNDDSATVTKLQSEISKNVQPSSTQTEIKQSTFENHALRSIKTSSVEHNPTILQNEPAKNPSSGTVDSETVGKPRKPTSLRGSLKPAKPILQPKKPKMTPEQLRMSYEQKRNELMQKHITKLNEIRSRLGIPTLSELRLHKREANILEDWYRDGKDVISDWWHNLRDWDSRNTHITEKIEEVTDLVTGRNKRHNDESITEQYPFPSLELFKNNRFKRDSNIVVSPRIIKETSLKKQIDDYLARQEDRQSQIRKFWEEKKPQVRAANPHMIYRRDLRQKVEKAKEWKEMKEKRRQNLAKHFEEMKQKLARHDPIISHRNKRDLQTIQDKIQEIRKKKQDHIHELKNKMEAKHSAEQSATQAPSKSKQEIENPVEKSATPAPTKLKTKQETEHPVEKPATPAPTASKPKIKSETEHPVEKPDTSTPSRKPKQGEIDAPRRQVNKTPKKSHKPLPVKEKSNRVHKREINENLLEEKLTSPSDLLKDLKLILFVDPELNTPQSVLDDSIFDDVDRLKRSISDNEIFEDDNEIGNKIKNKDHDDYKYRSKQNLNNLIEGTSTSTSNPLMNMKTDEPKIKSNVTQDEPSQENQTCQMTNYNVLKYLLCVAQKLWHNCIRF